MVEPNQTEPNTGIFFHNIGLSKFLQEFMMKKDSLVMNNMKKCSKKGNWQRIKLTQDTQNEFYYLFFMIFRNLCIC
jgi:hypothetical protein